MKIRLLMLGKTRGAEAEALLAEYVKRIARWCPIEVNELRDGEAALKKLDADRAATVRLLDAGGRAYDSAAFAKWMGGDAGPRDAGDCFCVRRRGRFSRGPARTGATKDFVERDDLLA